MEKTLLLNVTYEPLRVISWKKAIILFSLEKVEVIEAYDRMIHSVSLTMQLPSVVRLRQLVKWRRLPVKFSRENIYVRDHGACQYCGSHLKLHDVTYDHVVPKSQGGGTSWENVVICCVDCNRKKGGRTPKQAHMKLLTHPKEPSWNPTSRILMGLKHPPESWQDYLYWNARLEQ